MVKSKLLMLVRSLNRDEQKRLRDFIVSPYFNKRPELVELYDYLTKLFPEFSEDKLERKFIYKKLFPRQTYDEKEITYMMSFLSKLIERYLGQKKYEEKEDLVRIHRLEILAERGLNKHYAYECSQFEKIVNQKEEITSDFYHELLQLSGIKDEYFVINGGQVYDVNLQNSIDYLELFYFSKKLQLICEIEDRNRQMQQSYSYNLTGELLDYIEKSNLIDSPLVKSYYHVMNLLIANDAERHFEEILKLVDIDYEGLSFYDKGHVINYGINYAARMISKNKKPNYHAKACSKLYLYGIERQLLFKKGYLPPIHFRNVVMLGLNLREFDAIEAFINKYSPMLEDSERESLLYYSLAELSYVRKDYDSALESLGKVIYAKDIYYQLSAKLMQTRIYFDTDEEEALLSLLASFKLLLRRNKKYSKTKIQAYLNYCNILSRIMRKNKANKQKILDDISNKDLLVNKRWLLKALDQAIPD